MRKTRKARVHAPAEAAGDHILLPRPRTPSRPTVRPAEPPGGTHGAGGAGERGVRARAQEACGVPGGWRRVWGGGVGGYGRPLLSHFHIRERTCLPRFTCNPKPTPGVSLQSSRARSGR